MCYITKVTIATTKPQLSSAPNQIDNLTEEEICSLQGVGTIYQKIALCYTQCPAFIRKTIRHTKQLKNPLSGDKALNRRGFRDKPDVQTIR